MIVASPLTEAGNVPQLENTYPVSAVAVTSTLSSPVQIVNTLASALIAVPYGTSSTELKSTLPIVSSLTAIVKSYSFTSELYVAVYVASAVTVAIAGVHPLNV